MLRTSAVTIVFFISIALWLPASAQSQVDSLSIINKDHSLAPAEKIAMLSAEYDRIYEKNEENIDNLSNETLIGMFKASDMLSNYTLLKGRASSLHYVRIVNLTISELNKRGLVDASHYRAAMRTNIASRQFQEAKLLADISPLELSPSLQAMPSYGRRIILVGNQQNASVESVSIDEGIRLVIVSGCNVAAKAIQDIVSNSQLLKSVEDADALWLMPPTSYLDLEMMSGWNSSYPSQPIQMAFDSSEWPEIDFTIIPNFYIFKNGRVVDNISGWNESEKSNELQSLLNKYRK